MRNPIVVIGYILGSAMFVVGLLVLTGTIALKGETAPAFNTIFGVVILLFGLYRLVVTDSKRRQQMRKER